MDSFGFEEPMARALAAIAMKKIIMVTSMSPPTAIIPTSQTMVNVQIPATNTFLVSMVLVVG